MKKVFKCDYCSWTSHELDGSRTSETYETEEHEAKCEFNPLNTDDAEVDVSDIGLIGLN